MNILFDQGVPKPLRQYLLGNSVSTAYEKGWSDLRNGELLRKAEQDGYHVLITTDQNLQYQQNLTNRKLAILVLMSTSWPLIKAKAGKIQQMVTSMKANDYKEVFV